MQKTKNFYKLAIAQTSKSSKFSTHISPRSKEKQLNILPDIRAQMPVISKEMNLFI